MLVKFLYTINYRIKYECKYGLKIIIIYFNKLNIPVVYPCLCLAYYYFFADALNPQHLPSLLIRAS